VFSIIHNYLASETVATEAIVNIEIFPDKVSCRFPFASSAFSVDTMPVTCCLAVSECCFERGVASHDAHQRYVEFLLPSFLESVIHLGTVLLVCLLFFRRSPFQTPSSPPSIFVRCSISLSCLSLASAIVALREAMSPLSCTLFCSKDSDELREDEREDLRLDLSEILLALVDHEIVELLEPCSSRQKINFFPDPSHGFIVFARSSSKFFVQALSFCLVSQYGL